MLVYGRSKYILALVVLLLSVLYSLPNLYPQDPSVQITANRGSQVDAAFRIECNEWNGGSTLQARLCALTPHTPSSA